MRHQLAFLNTLINENKAWVANHSREFYILAFADDSLDDFRLQIELSGFNWSIFLLTRDDLDNFSPAHIIDPSHPLFHYRSHTVTNLKGAITFFDKSVSALTEFVKNKIPFQWPFVCNDLTADIKERFMGFLYGNHLTGQLYNNIDDDISTFLNEVGFKPTQHVLDDGIRDIIEITFYSFCKELHQRETNNISVPLLDKLNQYYDIKHDSQNAANPPATMNIGRVGGVIQGIKQNISQKRGMKIDINVIFSEDIYRHFPYISNELDNCIHYITQRCKELHHVRAEIISNAQKYRSLKVSFVTSETSLQEGMIFTETGLQAIHASLDDEENTITRQIT